MRLITLNLKIGLEMVHVPRGEDEENPKRQEDKVRELLKLELKFQSQND